MNTELTTKLNAAIETAAQLTLAFNTIALDAELGTTPAAVRVQAAKDLASAEQRVSALRGAIAAQAARDQQAIINAENVEAAAQREAMNAGLAKLNIEAASFDVALDALVEATARIAEAERAVTATPGVPAHIHQRLFRIRHRVLPLSERRLGREYIGEAQLP